MSTSRKQDFIHIMDILEFESESNTHELFRTLTKESRRSFSTFLTMDRSELQSLKVTNSNGNILKLGDLEVDEIINLANYARDLQAQKGMHFFLHELTKEDSRNYEIRKGITTPRPPISSLIPTEDAPVYEESTLKSYFRSTL